MRMEHLLRIENPKLLHFWGHTQTVGSQGQEVFSQWFPSNFTDGTYNYVNAEQYMMAMKAQLFNDNEILVQILSATSPKTMKALGRKIKNFDPNIWNQHKYDIVLRGTYLKFIQNPHLMEILLAHYRNNGDNIWKNVFVEASPYDKIWGIGMDKNNPDANCPAKWKGENLLGFALTEIAELFYNSNIKKHINSGVINPLLFKTSYPLVFEKFKASGKHYDEVAIGVPLFGNQNESASRYERHQYLTKHVADSEMTLVLTNGNEVYLGFPLLIHPEV